MENKIKNLQKKMQDYGVDYYFVPIVDEFRVGEILECDNRLKYLTDFTGSNGSALIARDGNHLFFTDGRYLVQARKQLNSDFIIKQIDKTDNHYKAISELSNDNKKIACDIKLLSVFDVSSMIALHKANPDNIVLLDTNLVDLIWDGKESKKKSRVFLHSMDYSGKNSKSKIEDLVIEMENEHTGTYLEADNMYDNMISATNVLYSPYKGNVSAVMISDPKSVCWLLNIRGRDLEYTPVALCYAIVHIDNRVQLFLDGVYDEVVGRYLKSHNVEIHKVSGIYEELQKLEGTVAINHQTPFCFVEHIKKSVVLQDFCLKPKANKNDIEVQGAINAHKKDGIALQKFFSWLEENLDDPSLTEFSLNTKLLEFRKQQAGFVSPSFASIVGFRENGAIIHYKAEKDTAKKIQGNGLLLIDSGGQYLEGTTDVTRTIAIGDPTQEQIHNFTLVLKGHIKVASAIFSRDTTGDDLDKLARGDLQKEDKDYPHSTGHGVGSFLSVHECPPAISKAYKGTFSPGMILSIEPGYYKENDYGIRIESLAYVKESQTEGFLEFEILTKVPISKKLIDFSLLSEDEIKWLNNYNKSVIMSPEA